MKSSIHNTADNELYIDYRYRPTCRPTSRVVGTHIKDIHQHNINNSTSSLLENCNGKGYPLRYPDLFHIRRRQGLLYLLLHILTQAARIIIVPPVDIEVADSY